MNVTLFPGQTWRWLIGAAVAILAVESPTGMEARGAQGGSALSTWESRIATVGRKHAEWLIAHQDDEALDPPLAATYYDAARVYYNISDFTNDPFWKKAAQAAVHVYRDRYVKPNKGGVPGYWNFGQGLAEDYRRTQNPESRDALFLLAEHAAFSRESTNRDSMRSAELSREVAYALMTRLEAESLGMAQSEYTSFLVETAFDHLDQWFSGKSVYVRPFMVSLTCEALIKYHGVSGDARVLPAVKRATDWMWNECWVKDGMAFRYTNIDTAALPKSAPGYNTGGTELAPDLNLLIAPAFAWVYRQTGERAYRERSEQAFAGAVKAAWLGNAKQFNQNYRWSFDMLKWLSNPEKNDGGDDRLKRVPSKRRAKPGLPVRRGGAR